MGRNRSLERSQPQTTNSRLSAPPMTVPVFRAPASPKARQRTLRCVARCRSNASTNGLT